jgi:hypothetical protein
MKYSADFFTGETAKQDTGLFQTATASEPVQQQPEVTWIDEDWSSVSVKSGVSGCVATQSRCQCFSGEGDPLRMETAECMRRIQQPLPYNIKPEFSNEERAAGSRRAEAELATAGPSASML